MWIVRLALRRPYTFVVMAVLIAILGGTAIVTMPVDIFPYIDIPVVSIVWSYQGLSPEEMEKRMVTIFERSMTTTVNDIEHIESQSYSGVSVVRVYFQPNVKIDMALAQITAISQTLLRIFPPGTTPPNIVKYDASSVPILQLALESKTLSEQDIFDLGLNFIRTQLATVQGAAVPTPYGGKFRQINVDLIPEQLYAKGLSATDVSNAVSAQSVILPAGDAKIGKIDYQIKVNSSPRLLDQLNDMPIRVVNGAGPRRVCRAEQHRAHQRHARDPDDGVAQRPGVHARDRNRGQSQASPDPGRTAAGAASPPIVRSIAVRARVHQRRGARGRHCRISHRHDDPALPGQLAQHHHRVYFDSALYSHFADGLEPAR
jgi:multidrug efflux pump subunit AcrB